MVGWMGLRDSNLNKLNLRPEARSAADGVKILKSSNGSSGSALGSGSLDGDGLGGRGELDAATREVDACPVVFFGCGLEVLDFG